ncbi:MAG: hypothetical protein APF77_16525 [Clostridia bacterium BRH_c25]|nr:MAG: hypothetical protein APF77_16525 [Clostridia bacterium BRH_c25]
MGSRKWDIVDIDTEEGRVSGIAPVIISASRSTDIPAFYSEWLINRLGEGYVKWINPFNRKPQYITFEKARVIVFWTKDAGPLVPCLSDIDKKGINYYFLFTMNDYGKEGFEPRVRKLEDRIDTFKLLSEKIGKDKVIWRFDPLILTDQIDVEALLDKIYKIGSRIADYTNKLIISFVDISIYRKVQNNLLRRKINYKEFTPEAMETVAKELSTMNRSWGLEIATCSEGIDLSRYNIKRNKCIDYDLLLELFPQDEELMSFLDYEDNHSNKVKKLKDKGQREYCGCIVSKDIGQYDTCNHQCLYCYANSSPENAAGNYQRHLKSSRNRESIL